ncbi:MAG: hypothetical protein ACT4PM_02235 [Gemmatimonadales bacterium]
MLGLPPTLPTRQWTAVPNIKPSAEARTLAPRRGGPIYTTLAYRRIPMLVVRNCFVAKPGNASKLAAQLKEAAQTAKLPRFRVLTDLTGEFNRVILEYEAENAAAFEATLKEYASNPAWREKMKGYTELWQTGTREILQVA